MTMRMMRAVAAGVVMAGMSAAVVAQEAQPQQPTPVRDPAAVTVGGAQSGAAHTWTDEQLLTSTVHQAWMLSGRTRTSSSTW